MDVLVPSLYKQLDLLNGLCGVAGFFNVVCLRAVVQPVVPQDHKPMILIAHPLSFLTDEPINNALKSHHNINLSSSFCFVYVYDSGLIVLMLVWLG